MYLDFRLKINYIFRFLHSLTCTNMFSLLILPRTSSRWDRSMLYQRAFFQTPIFSFMFCGFLSSLFFSYVSLALFQASFFFNLPLAFFQALKILHVHFFGWSRNAWLRVFFFFLFLLFLIGVLLWCPSSWSFGSFQASLKQILQF